MAELTKERLEEIHAEYSKPNHSKSFSVKDSKIAEMARQLLAGQEQEPVYQVLGDGSWTDYSKQQLEDLLESKPSTLFRVAYAAPQLPQTAVPGEIQKLKDGRGFKYVKDGVHYSVNYANGWNQCRAAMLQGAEPASNHEELSEENGSSLQLRNLIRHRHAEWSDKTFGYVGPVGPLKHLSKEALEAAAEPDDLREWADMQFLLWDAQRRAGISDAEITAAMEDKLKINMERQWPEPKDGEPRFHIKEPGNSPVTPDGSDDG